MTPSHRAAVKYALALADPRSSGPCGLPYFPSVPSVKYKWTTCGTFSTSSVDGVGFITVAPCYDNSSTCVEYSQSSATTHDAWTNHSPATQAMCTVPAANLGASYMGARTVALALYIRNVTPLLNRGGQCIFVRGADGLSMRTALTGFNTLAEINAQRASGNAVSIDASTGRWHSFDYIKTDPTDYDYVHASFPAGTGFCLGAYATAPATSVQTFEWEIVHLCEYIGQFDNNAAVLPGTTPSNAHHMAPAVEARVVRAQTTPEHNLSSPLQKLQSGANFVTEVLNEGRAAYTAVKGAAGSILELAAAAA